jgi:DNA-binding transcriptional MerR regulator
MLGDVSHIMMNEDEAAFRERLNRSSTVPEFTMQAVSSETDVPGDTLRSWQRRYGFPTPARNDANYRLFSRQDIEAVRWIRDQTARGQGTRQAIAMLQRIREEPSSDSSSRSIPSIVESPPATPSAPPDGFIQALIAGDLVAAQKAWDHLAIAVSPPCLCETVILPAHRRVWEGDGDPGIRVPAEDFLQRKVTTLLDRSSPECGLQDIVVLVSGDVSARVPALALATVLSTSGYRLPVPVMDLRDAESIVVLHHLPSETPAIVVAPDGLHGARHLLPERDVFHWWYDGASRIDEDTLPPSLADVVTALQESG